MLSDMLTKAGMAHQVLNAKYHAIEADIIAKAGKHGQITIATNMAGRGTDIKLDEEAKAAGGLLVIGTERHESRRMQRRCGQNRHITSQRNWQKISFIWMT